jgi:hypothetical protein
MGRKADTFELTPYREDSFYWSLTYDETVKLARNPVFPAEYHILKFGSEAEQQGITCLWWNHQSGLAEPGEAFRKVDGNPIRDAPEDL